jgi:hypothetical protein
MRTLVSRKALSTLMQLVPRKMKLRRIDLYRVIEKRIGARVKSGGTISAVFRLEELIEIDEFPTRFGGEAIERQCVSHGNLLCFAVEQAIHT